LPLSKPTLLIVREPALAPAATAAPSIDLTPVKAPSLAVTPPTVLPLAAVSTPVSLKPSPVELIFRDLTVVLPAASTAKPVELIALVVPPRVTGFCVPTTKPPALEPLTLTLSTEVKPVNAPFSKEAVPSVIVLP